ncbi:carbamoyltransferase HypF [Leptolyngbya sp. BL0902]|nr:carbamoyltransferase HypF [Leptolyngbya sp. BL0902]
MVVDALGIALVAMTLSSDSAQSVTSHISAPYTPKRRATPQATAQPLVETPLAEVLRVTGTVQGVGFRPTVYRLAVALGLRGHVLNDGEGVLIHLAGTSAQIDQFVTHLLKEKPPLAKIACIQRQSLPLDAVTEAGFTIVESAHTPARTEIPPDAATCPQCLADIFNPRRRHFRYPFTNCTHCGPRLSIIRHLPYDRQSTSMAWFEMCPSCRQEYQDVGHRRFHAQPTACPVCGPKVWLERADGKPLCSKSLSLVDEAEAIATLILRGEIVAIKGLGGVHLACDATNEAAVQTLRQRKHRYHKPFALMVKDLAAIAPYCDVSPQEAELLQSPAAPIVLLTPVENSKFKVQGSKFSASSDSRLPSPPLPLSPSLSPGLGTLGVMLPYTPLHHLILQRLDRPIVMTSGNRSDEPQCITNEAVREQLGDIATYFLLHNRDIVNRVDDSVVRVVDGQPQILRRARGYAPAPIALPAGFEDLPPILALGGELKSTFCLLRPGQAILSQHLGDLENAAAHQGYRQALDLYLNLFEYDPTHLVVDAHPEYLSTKLGQDWAERQGLALTTVQHHHAHIAACMADNGLPLDTAPVLGIALDGLGYGDDGTLWGGEVLLADYRQYQRLAHLKPVAMLGGTQAIRQPWRNTYAHLVAAFGSWDAVQKAFPKLDLVRFFKHQPLALLDTMLAQNLNAPLASSAGRLFDAVAAAVGLCRETATYEGQGAIELEALIQPHHLETAQNSAYAFTLQGLSNAVGARSPRPPILETNRPDSASELQPLILDPAPMWPSLLQDLQQNAAPALISARFHVGFANALSTLVQHLAQHHQATTVALSGGVFQNQILTAQVTQRLQTLGLTVLTHHQVPPNDGGLSLGQAVIAAAQSAQPPP